MSDCNKKCSESEKANLIEELRKKKREEMTKGKKSEQSGRGLNNIEDGSGSIIKPEMEP